LCAHLVVAKDLVLDGGKRPDFLNHIPERIIRRTDRKEVEEETKRDTWRETMRFC